MLACNYQTFKITQEWNTSGTIGFPCSFFTLTFADIIVSFKDGPYKNNRMFFAPH